MTLVAEWKEILRKAWSIRLILLAGFFSGLEIVVPYLPEFLPIPRGLFAAIAFVATNGAFVTRLLAQKNLNQPEGK